MKQLLTLCTTVLLLCMSGWAQDAGLQGHVQLDRSGSTPVFRVTVVERTTKAISYRHRSGSTPIEFRGTALMPDARGDADVNSKQGRIEISARIEHLTPATQFGPEYLTYVLWAITPEGRPANLGEVLLNGSRSKLDVTTDLQTFGLIITAEPYFAVTQPSDVVVMENFVTKETQGTIEQIDAKYELLQRGQYVLNVSSSELRPMTLDRKTPLELYEARNALRIARWTGAEQYAADTLQKAQISLQNAEDELTNHKVGRKTVAQNSRDAAQNAEDARLITIQKMRDEDAANRKAADDAEKAKSEADRLAAERETEQANQAKTQAERAQGEAQADAERARNEAEAARAAALAQQQAAQAQIDQARQAAAQAEQEKAQLRDQLRQQLNVILETRETARGLIVNMSDVLFDTGKYSLKPGAREKLAKISGIILAHPGLQIEVDGHTDNMGSDELNQRLSEQRANAVRDYFVAEGLSGDTITAMGFGKTRPVTNNNTAAGRQQNRRVELVVSGEAIGSTPGQPSQ